MTVLLLFLFQIGLPSCVPLNTSVLGDAHLKGGEIRWLDELEKLCFLSHSSR